MLLIILILLINRTCSHVIYELQHTVCKCHILMQKVFLHVKLLKYFSSSLIFNLHIAVDPKLQ